jgi:hypothetical protein
LSQTGSRRFGLPSLTKEALFTVKNNFKTAQICVFPFYIVMAEKPGVFPVALKESREARLLL